MTSEGENRTGAEAAYVWVWLPGETQPVVAGRLFHSGDSPADYHFTYGRSYLANERAIPLSATELALREGIHRPAGLHLMPSCLRDAGPDAWGRRILENRHAGKFLDELDYLLLSGSDRIGALDFQAGSDVYQPRGTAHPTLDDLARAAALVEQRQPLPAALEQALLHGTSVGGARPKALLTQGSRHFIAKFSSTTDSYDAVKAEYVAMRLAGLCGIEVPEVRLERALGKDALLVERFDRVPADAGATRRGMLSALSLLQLDEMEARHARYPDLADVVRQRFPDPEASLHELFRRVAFNVLVGNTDDHARNHSAFWDGVELRLTPAYDLCPQLRTGGEASQAMDIAGKHGNLSTLANVRSTSGRYFLTTEAATDLVDAMIDTVKTRWDTVCDEANLADGERQRLMGGAVLNPFCFEGWDVNAT